MIDKAGQIVDVPVGVVTFDPVAEPQDIRDPKIIAQ
jgi:hypothetical protein